MELRSLALTAMLALAVGTACVHAPSEESQVPSTPLIAPGGSSVDTRQLVAKAPFTVLVFFSRACHCLSVHDARIRALYDATHARGVQWVMVDSEVRASPEVDAAEGARRGYAFPILLDHGGQLADALGAQYATYSVIVDAQGLVRYRGGIDSDNMHLRDDATQYLGDALEDLLAGRSPRVASTKAMGCALEKW